MAHNLEQINGITSFAYNEKNGLPWHGLGQKVDQNMTVAQALELSHANYQVGAEPIFVMTPQLKFAIANGTVTKELLDECTISGKKATVRTDTYHPMGVVGDKYQIVQNAQAFQFVDDLCSMGKGAPVIDTAGVLGNGERVFVCAKFDDKIQLSHKDDDYLDMYCVFTTSHDGTGAVTAMITPTRVVCNNTLNLAMGTATGKLYFRHTSNVGDRINLTKAESFAEASKVLGVYNRYKEELLDRIVELQNTPVKEDHIQYVFAHSMCDVKEYLDFDRDGLTALSDRSRKNYDYFREVLESGVGQKEYECEDRGSAMWLINGFTTYFNNYKNYSRKNNNAAIRKFDGILSGTENTILQKVNNLIA